MEVTVRNQTNNQSTADYSRRELLLFDNRFSNTQISNPDGLGVGNVLLKGTLLARAADGTVVPYSSISAGNVVTNTNKIVGVLTSNELVTVAKETTIAVSGDINSSEIIAFNADGTELTALDFSKLDAGTGLTLGDALERLGFNLQAGVQNQKFDN